MCLIQLIVRELINIDGYSPFSVTNSSLLWSIHVLTNLTLSFLYCGILHKTGNYKVRHSDFMMQHDSTGPSDSSWTSLHPTSY